MKPGTTGRATCDVLGFLNASSLDPSRNLLGKEAMKLPRHLPVFLLPRVVVRVYGLIKHLLATISARKRGVIGRRDEKERG